jgi:hypothetical protein
MFDLTLNLQSMKEKIGWDDNNFKDHLYTTSDGSLESGSVYPYLHEGRTCLPCRTTCICELYDPFRHPTPFDAHGYYKAFLVNVLHLEAEKAEEVSNHMYLIFEEALTNTLRHGGRKRKGRLLTIENHHPFDPSKMILRISNPNARAWDYITGVENKMWREGLYNHGTVFFNNMKGVLVSYENEGRDFLALFDLLNLGL